MVAATRMPSAPADPQARRAPLYGVPGLVRPVSSHGYAEGAPPGFSGGFTEQSCDACHFHAAPNSGPGRLALEGVPERFVPGERYPLTVSLTHAGMTFAGFQLAARFTDDGTQAGTLAPADDRVGVDAQSGVQYAGQRREGAAATDAARWTIHWTAPSATRAVVFHVAANAANGDERADGDFVYSTSVEVPARK
jgi:hypothetical protein